MILDKPHAYQVSSHALIAFKQVTSKHHEVSSPPLNRQFTNAEAILMCRKAASATMLSLQNKTKNLRKDEPGIHQSYRVSRTFLCYMVRFCPVILR